MPDLACHACGRQVYTTVPLEALFAEERRCPRCGALLAHERRLSARRQAARRVNPDHDPGPPPGMAERRLAARRTWQRRVADRNSFGP